MFHANAWGLPYASTLVGAKQVFPGNSLTPDRVLQLIQDERVTLGAGVPTIWIGALPLLQAGKYDLSSVTRIACGGSAAPRGLIEAYDKLGLNILHAWGMTEMSPLGTVSILRQELTAADRDDAARLQARGRACPCQASSCGCWTATATRSPWDGQTMGELVARGPWVDRGLLQRRAQRGLVHRRRLVPHRRRRRRCSPNGYIEIADRTKDLIKSGGEWISSVALENALMAHPKVQEAAVIAVPDERWSERPLACVVARPGLRGRDHRGRADDVPGGSSSPSGGCPSATCSWTSCPRPASASSTRRRCAQQHAARRIAAVTA